MDRPVMLKIRELPEHFKGTSEHMWRQLCISGRLPHLRIGRKILVCEQIATALLRGNNAPQDEPTDGKIRRVID